MTVVSKALDSKFIDQCWKYAFPVRNLTVDKGLVLIMNKTEAKKTLMRQLKTKSTG